MCFCFSLVCAFLFLLAIIGVAHTVLRNIKLDARNKYVLITGCDTGFGRLLAEQLDEEGCRVIAACLTKGTVDELREKLSSKAMVMKMDVSKHEDVERALEAVQNFIPAQEGLWGVVNNAGIMGPVAPNDFLTKTHYEQVFQVNFFGMVDVCLSFLPLLRSTKGRIVNTSSVNGRYSPALAGPYSSSKHAVEGFSKGLTDEMSYFGIHVAIIEPGMHRTTFLQQFKANRIRQYWNEADADRKQFYGENYVEQVLSSMGSTFGGGSNPQKVIDAYKSALFSWFPKYLYAVGWDARFIFIPLSSVPVSLRLWIYKKVVGTTLK